MPLDIAPHPRRNILAKERRVLTQAWGSKCAYCEKKSGPFAIDHIVPHSRGGTCDIENLCLSCERCNQRKKDTPLPQFYEGLILAIAKRKAARIRKALSTQKRRYRKPLCAAEAVFGQAYVRKYISLKIRSGYNYPKYLLNNAPVTASDMLNYEKRVAEVAASRQTMPPAASTFETALSNTELVAIYSNHIFDYNRRLSAKEPRKGLWVQTMTFPYRILKDVIRQVNCNQVKSLSMIKELL